MLHLQSHQEIKTEMYFLMHFPGLTVHDSLMRVIPSKIKRCLHVCFPPLILLPFLQNTFTFSSFSLQSHDSIHVVQSTADG